MRPVLVTGGTGFVGSALVPHLLQAGCEVHLFARPTADRARFADLDVHWHAGDLEDEDSIRRAVAAVATRSAESTSGAWVVHGAARISYRREDAEVCRRSNVEGTRRVLDACRIHDVERVCLVSSVVAVGFARSVRETLDEESAFNGYELGCQYTTTKRAAEDFALAVSKQQDVVAVNPGAVFGASTAASNTKRFLAALAAGRLGRFAPPGSIAVVGVQDVAAGILLALEKGRRGRRYLLTESSLTHLELQQRAAAALGARGPRRAMPRLAWRAVCAGASLLERVRRPEHVTACALRHLGVHYRFDSSRAREELGWSPETFDRVLRTCVDQFVAENPSP